MEVRDGGSRLEKEEDDWAVRTVSGVAMVVGSERPSPVTCI